MQRPRPLDFDLPADRPPRRSLTPSRRAHGAIFALALSCALTPEPPAAADELKSLLKSLEKAAEQQLDSIVEESRRALETTALVSRVDYGMRPSFVVRTTDGRTFQTRGISLSASTDVSVQLGAALRADFSRLGGNDYEISFTFPKVEPTSSGRAASILAGAANDWLGNSGISKIRTQVRGALGTALDGSDWFLDLGRVGLRSIEYLAPEQRQEPPPPPRQPPPVQVAGAPPPDPVRPASPAPSPEARFAGSVPRLPTPPPAPPARPTTAPLEASPQPAPLAPPSLDREPEPRPLDPPDPPRDARHLGFLRRLEGSFGSCTLESSPKPYAGDVVLIERAGVAIARAQILDRTFATCNLEILEEFGAEHSRPGDRIALAPK